MNLTPFSRTAGTFAWNFVEPGFRAQISQADRAVEFENPHDLSGQRCRRARGLQIR